VYVINLLACCHFVFVLAIQLSSPVDLSVTHRTGNDIYENNEMDHSREHRVDLWCSSDQ
jgi:hypothetical protein